MQRSSLIGHKPCTMTWVQTASKQEKPVFYLDLSLARVDYV